MTHISNVLEWKFDSQPGMSTVGDIITAFPGTMPTDAELATYTAEYEVWKSAMDQIELLEASITQRRMREHALGTGGTFLADTEALIEIERDKL